MTVWFTADLHLGHRNIIEHCHRPWATVEEMDEALIWNWNRLVKPGDSVYVLGDIAMCKLDRAVELVSQLQGQKFLIVGNHDKGLTRKKAFTDLFVWVKDLYCVKIADPEAHGGKRRIVLCHYAMRTWHCQHYGTWHLYGHSHGTLPVDPHSLSADVGVDAQGYSPVSYENVKDTMVRRTFVPLDHHIPESK